MSYQQWTVEKHIMQPYNKIQCKDEEVLLCIMLYGLQEYIRKDTEKPGDASCLQGGKSGWSRGKGGCSLSNTFTFYLFYYFMFFKEGATQ